MSFFGTNPPNNSFGTPQPVFGSASNTSFGTQQPSAFGTPQFQSTGFGSSSNQIFGAAQPTGFGTATNTGFGSVFSSQPNQTFGTGSIFGPNNAFSGFGAKTTTPTFSFTPVAAKIGTGFGTPQPTGFGVTANTGFGSGQNAQPNLGFGSFGTQQPNVFSGFGANIPTQASSFNPSTFGQQTQQQQHQQQQPLQIQQPNIHESQAFYQSIFQCYKFGDERDAILANLNYVQACMGKGKGHYSQTFPPVIYTPQNPYCRFKAVGYSFLFPDSNEDGQVILTLNKSPDKVQSGETQIIASLQTIFNRPHIHFKICAIKPTGDQSTVILVAEDRSTNRRVPAYDLAAVLTQSFVKSQLHNMGILSVIPKVKPSPEQLNLYLQNPPSGIDARVWNKAQQDNPVPSLMIPVVILGTEDLKRKVLWQDGENRQHQTRIQLIQQEISALTTRYSALKVEVEHLTRKHYETAHKIMKVIARIDTAKNAGLPIQPVEEELKKRLQSMDDELNTPNECKAQITELISQMKIQKLKSATERKQKLKCNVDKENIAQIKDFLAIQQKSTKYLVEATDGDLKNLNRLKMGIEELSRKMIKPC